MKKGIHPNYTALKIRIAEESFETKSTYKGKELLMDVDFRTHPAWTKKGLSDTHSANKSISSFKKKFSGLAF
jgi:large subunit ribosomal protein L31